MNFAILSFIIGFILQFEALFLLLPWIVGMIYGEYHVALIYLVTAAVCFILGKLLSFRHTGRFKELYVREGFTAVALRWFVMSVFGAIPFVLTGEIPFYGRICIYNGDPADDGWLHHEPDACGEPRSFRQQAGTESTGYCENPLWTLYGDHCSGRDHAMPVRYAVV